MAVAGLAAYLAAGATLGLSGGLAPGPLSALIVRQSLAFGPREGIKVALVPLVTDIPLLLGSAVFASQIAAMNTVLAVIGLVGAGFLVFLAWESVHTTELSLQADGDPAAGSVRRALITNLLNPHAYLFWVVIGGPLVAGAWAEGLASTSAFLAGFFGGLCGCKVALAFLVGSQRSRLGGLGYRWTMRALGAALLVFAALFVWDAIGRLARAV